MLAVWSDRFSRALCQTVPSPFGGGSSDPEVASCSPPLAVVPCDGVEEGLLEARAAWSSRAGHAQLTAATSVKVQSCLPPRPCQAVNGDPCASDCLSVARRDACIARNSMGQASRSLCPATMALPGLDLDMGKVTVAAKLGSRRVLPRGVALLRGALGHGRHRQPPSPCPLLAPWRPSLRPPIGRAPLGGALRR